jgi:hypothetical protein
MPWLTLLDVLFLVTTVVLLIQQRVDRRRLRQFVGALPALPTAERARIDFVASICFRLPQRVEDPTPLAMLFAPLGATPSAVLRHGASCSGLSRLMILMLAELGIRARQITLYHHDGHAQHCLIEADLADGPLIVDPAYGIALVGPTDAPFGLKDLQEGVPPRQCALLDGEKCGYPSDDYYNFDYRLSKTVNWTKTPLRRFVYRALSLLVRRRVDSLAVPTLLEWPQYLFILIAATVLVGVHLGIALALLAGAIQFQDVSQSVISLLGAQFRD